MSTTEEARGRLAGIPGLTVSICTTLSRYTRFGIGGPADILVETGSAEAFVAALDIARSSGLPTVVIGGGTNLIVSDRGFRGIVLRYRGDCLRASGEAVVADAGAVLQDLVDFAIERGLRGLAQPPAAAPTLRRAHAAQRPGRLYQRGARADRAEPA